MNTAIANIRGIQKMYLNALCTVQFPTRVADDAGGETVTWTNRYTNLPCRIAPMTAGYTLQMIAAGIKDQITSVFTAEYGKQVDVGDRVIWDGHTYTVVSNVSQGSIETAVRRYMSEVK